MRIKYIVCPVCKRIELVKNNTSWMELYTETVSYEMDWNEDDGYFNYGYKHYDDSDFIGSYHRRCGQQIDGYHVDELIVTVEDGEIVRTGEYWRNKIDELKKIFSAIEPEKPKKKQNTEKPKQLTDTKITQWF